MTTDSLLALLLSVVLPGTLALLGGILTIRTLKAHKLERWSWLAIFMFLFVLSLVLGVMQQVRLTVSQTKAQEESQQRERHITENQRYTQGQLDSIGNVLRSLVTSGGGSEMYRSTLSGLLSAMPKQVASSPKALQMTIGVSSLSNRELKYRTLEMVGRIRDIEHETSVAGRALNEEGFEHSYQMEHKAWEPIHSECLSLRDELVVRLPASVTSLDSNVQSEIDSALMEGNAFGYGSLGSTAAYLEKLAYALPVSKVRAPAK